MMRATERKQLHSESRYPSSAELDEARLYVPFIRVVPRSLPLAVR